MGHLSKLELIYDFGLINVLKIESTGHVLTCPCQGFPINTGSALGTDQTPFRLAFGHFESELDLVSQAF